MQFEIEITAKSTDPGGLLGSLNDQLSELEGEITVLSEGQPYRVDQGDSFYFEVINRYRVTPN